MAYVDEAVPSASDLAALSERSCFSAKPEGVRHKRDSWSAYDAVDGSQPTSQPEGGWIRGGEQWKQQLRSVWISASRSFRFTVLIVRERLSFNVGSCELACWHSSLSSRLAWSRWRPAQPPTIGP